MPSLGWAAHGEAVFSSRMDNARTYTLEDLADWPSIHAGVSLAVLGHPIKHSISPMMHNAALAAMAREDRVYSTWRYFRFDVPPQDLPRALVALHARGFHGVNLTVPHKVLAVSCVAKVDEGAQAAGAVNTLCWSADGWQGFNTDGYGLESGLIEELGVSLVGAHVVLLGAGGAARAAAAECLRRRCASLWIGNRTRSNLDALISSVEPLAKGVPVRGFDPAQMTAVELPAAALVINATSAGLHETDPLPIDLGKMPATRAIYDMIYNPAETRLLLSAKKLGVPVANGLSMLVHQGARALEIWSNRAVPVEVMADAARAAMGRQANRIYGRGTTKSG